MRTLLTSSVASVSLLALSTALAPSLAWAQTTTAPPGAPESSQQDDDPSATPAAEQDPAATAEESAAPLDTGSGDNAIVVTGSRIARPEFSFPNPVQSYTSETIEQSGQTNLTDFLANSPQLLSSTDNQDVAGSNLPNAQFTGVNLLNLRSLGTQRTLVLVDGRRHIAGIYGTAQVDINTIPVDLIDRIDVLTGGTSAVYGADGVSGVVNFVMKKNFEGLSLRGQSSISQRGDAGNRFIAATFGKNFAEGAGNFAIAYEFNELDRFKQVQRLGYGRSGPTVTMIRNPADFPDVLTLPDFIPSDEHPLGGDLRWVASSPGGAIDLDLDYYPDFTGEGDVYDRGTPVRGTAFTVGGSSTSREIYFGDFTPYTRRHNFNALFNYEFSPAIRLFAEGKYVNIKALSDGQPTYDFLTVLFEDNAYLNQRYGNLVQGDAYNVGRDHLDFGLRRSSNERDTYRGVIGIDGKFSDHLKYEASYTYGKTDAVSNSENDRYKDRYFAAIDAVVNPANGQITCRINLPGETMIQGFGVQPEFFEGTMAPVSFTPGQCVPLNILGYGAPSQAALDWVLVDHSDEASLRQHVLSGSVSGDTGGFFNLPGGPIGFALGAEYRKEKSSYTPDEIVQQGLLGDFAQVSPASGKFDVKEAFGEIRLPLVKESFIHALEVGGAVRFSDYSSVGNTVSWSTNASFAPVRDISFRGTYSQAVRAPNIAELYSAQTGTFAFIADPCGINNLAEGSQFRQANCAAALTAIGINPATFDPANDPFSPQNSSIEGTTGGNPNLAEETAKTLTMGVVFRPRFLSGFQLAFDWYDIKLKGAISTPAITTLVNLCYDQPTLDNVYCDAIGRGGLSGYINDFTVGPENVASYRTAGLDVALNYRFRAPWNDGSMFNLKVNANYLHRLEFIATPGADVDVDRDEANLALGETYPRYSATGDLTWTKGDFTINYGVNWYNRTRRYTTEQMAANPDRADERYVWYKAYWEHQVQLALDINKRMNAYFGVNNLWDEKPDVAVTGYPVSATGRYFYAGVKIKAF